MGRARTPAWRQRNIRNTVEEMGPACETCALRTGCASAQEGTFCTRWRSKDAPERGESPAEKWARGEEADV